MSFQFLNVKDLLSLSFLTDEKWRCRGVFRQSNIISVSLGGKIPLCAGVGTRGKCSILFHKCWFGSCLVAEKVRGNISMKPLKNVNQCLCSLCSSQFCRTNINCMTYLMEYWQEFQWANLAGILILLHRIPHKQSFYLQCGAANYIYDSLSFTVDSKFTLCIVTLNIFKRKYLLRQRPWIQCFSSTFTGGSMQTTILYQRFRLPLVQGPRKVTKTDLEKLKIFLWSDFSSCLCFCAWMQSRQEASVTSR